MYLVRAVSPVSNTTSDEEMQAAVRLELRLQLVIKASGVNNDPRKEKPYLISSIP